MPRIRSFSYAPAVLVYHHIYAGRRPAAGRTGDAVGLEDFEGQMRTLRERRFNVASLSSLVSAMERRAPVPPRTVAITFDDGYRSTYTRAQPVLRKYGLAACIFLVTDYLADGPTLGDGARRFDWLPEGDGGDARPISWQEAEALVAGGMEVGSHTATHGFPPRMAAGELEAELVRSKEKIETMLGRAPFALALPFSFPIVHRRWPSFRRDLLAAMRKASYTCCCTLQRGGVRDGGGALFLPRVAVTGRDTPLSFYAKALGLYRYTGVPHRIYQAFFKKYGGTIGP
jgi:peptidoglycan/xylan/chitin deacetylase (PgdA/CDA1 family)